MKQLLKELGFEELPMLSAFVTKLENSDLSDIHSNNSEDPTQAEDSMKWDKATQYILLIVQPITEESCRVFKQMEVFEDNYKQTKRRTVWLIHETGRFIISQRLEFHDGKVTNRGCAKYDTIEDAINDGAILIFK